MADAEPTRDAPRGLEVAVIVVLVGTAVGIGVSFARGGFGPRRGPVFATQSTQAKLRLLTDDWYSTFRDFPPSQVQRLHEVTKRGRAAADVQNQTNAGVEALYQALLWDGFPALFVTWDNEHDLANTDEDWLERPVNRVGDAELHEFRDAWGHPFIYFHADDYAAAADGGVPYINGNLDRVMARPRRREDGSFARPNTYQLFSMGEDGEPNTEDDITIDDLGTPQGSK